MRHVDGGGEPWPASVVKGTAPGEIRRSLQQFDFSETVVPHAWGDQGFHRLGRLEGMGGPREEILGKPPMAKYLGGECWPPCSATEAVEFEFLPQECDSSGNGVTIAAAAGCPLAMPVLRDVDG
jgi:hypothetical protein